MVRHSSSSGLSQFAKWFEWFATVRQVVRHSLPQFAKWFATVRQVVHHSSSSGSPQFAKWFATVCQVFHHSLLSGLPQFVEGLPQFVKWFATVRQVVRHSSPSGWPHFVKWFATVRQVIGHSSPSGSPQVARWFAAVHLVVHETITKKPLCFISLQIIISIIALDQTCFIKASSAQPHTKDYWNIAYPFVYLAIKTMSNEIFTIKLQ